MFDNSANTATLPSLCAPGFDSSGRVAGIWEGEQAPELEALFQKHPEVNEFRVEGENGFSFWGDPQSANFTQALGRAPLSDEVLSQWIHYFSELEQKLQASGRTLVIATAPAKWEIYPENLPTWTIGARGQTRLDQFLNHSGKLPVVDLRAALRDSKEVAPPYSAVNSHWSPYGGMVAWERILGCATELYPDSLWGEVPRSEALSVELVAAPNEFTPYGDATSPQDWAVPKFADAGEVQVTKTSASGALVESDGDAPLTILDLPATTTSEDGKGTALIVRDSTGDSLDRLWGTSFAKTCQVRHNLDYPGSRTDVVSEAEQCEADTVLYLFTERYFAQAPPSL